MQHDPFLSMLAEQADLTFQTATHAYERALADQHRDIAQAKAAKTHLADGYWQPAHKARLRYLAVVAVAEVLNET